MDPYTILICDDKEAVHESLGYFLNKEGMNVVSAYNGESVLLKFSANKIDLIVLDVMLPGMDGIEVCRIIRRESDVPIIFLSAKGEEMDRIRGLEIGGDDYVTKLFSPREIALRIKILLNRRNPGTGNAADATSDKAFSRSGQPAGNGLPAGAGSEKEMLQYQELRLNQATMQDVERAAICKVLRENGGNVSQSARILKMSRQSLQYRMRKYGIKVEEL